MSSRIPVHIFRTEEVYIVLPHFAAIRFSFPSQWPLGDVEKARIGPHHKPHPPGASSARTDFSDTALSLISLLMGFSPCWSVSDISRKVAAPRFAATWPRATAASGGSPPGATISTRRASERRGVFTPIMEEQRTALCQMECTLGIRMERIQAIAYCRRRVGFGVVEDFN